MRMLVRRLANTAPLGTVRRLATVALLALFPLMLATVAGAEPPPSVPLWPEGAPGSIGKSGEEVVRVNEYGEHIVSNIHRPSVTVYLPSAERSTGAAVIVIPGGGHVELWMDHEGYAVGRFLADQSAAEGSCLGHKKHSQVKGRECGSLTWQ